MSVVAKAQMLMLEVYVKKFSRTAMVNMDIKIVLILSIIFGGVEILLCKFSEKSIMRFTLPTILFALSAVLILIGKLAPLEGMQDLAYIVMGILAGISAAISLVVALVCALLRGKNGKK